MPTSGWPDGGNPTSATRDRAEVPGGAECSRFVLLSSEVADRASAGGKAYALSVLHRAIPEIPDWFVIQPSALATTLGKRLLCAVEEGRTEIGDVDLGADLRAEIESALRCVCPQGDPVAVRSSAVEEDGAVASFAGQLESYLDVVHDDVPRRVVDVWRSGFTPRVRTYRRERGLVGNPRAPAVLVQRMARAEVSGIAFSSDPVSARSDTCIVCATRGLGDRLVSGEVEGDTFRVRGDEVVAERLEGECAALTDDQVREVAGLARRAEAAFGCPQDIEWAIARDRLHLLQSRPITTLESTTSGSRAPTREGGVAVLWDNSNIVESYSGVTSPLTFTFARYAYEAVYRQFVAHLGVSARVIGDHAEVFRNMLGLVHGRVYYNLLNWYRVLALLPGFDANRRLLDRMLGIEHALPRSLLDDVAPAPARGSARPREWLGVLRSSLRIVTHWLFLRRRSARFQRRVGAALGTPVSRVESMRLDELGAHYRELEHSLLERWDAPVLNDFYCMVFFGLSRHVLRKWARREGAGLHGAFMQDQGGIISTEPARRIREMADLVAGDARLCAALTSPDWRPAMDSRPELRAAFDQYMERFGDRCVQELKLESPTLYDDPSTLVATIGHLAAQPDRSAPRHPHVDPRPALRRLLRGSPFRLLLARWLLRHARRHVRARENLRFERTRIFGRVRRVFVQMGQRLTDAALLDEPEQVFHLQVQELLGAVEGTLSCTDLRGLARVRHEESERLRAEPDPPSRFVTYGAVAAATIHAIDTVPGAAGTNADSPETERRGLGCSPGIGIGSARVIEDPRGQSLVPGEILVARHTDPGWVLLFATAAGLIVERGSLLCDSAIVARELGIPAVVSVPGVMEWLADGDRIEVDGTRGTVRRIPRD